MAMESTTAVEEACNMAPSTLDLLIITFNCAKSFIDPTVFASHLEGPLQQNSTRLPDLVVL